MNLVKNANYGNQDKVRDIDMSMGSNGTRGGNTVEEKVSGN